MLPLYTYGWRDECSKIGLPIRYYKRNKKQTHDRDHENDNAGMRLVLRSIVFLANWVNI